MCPETDLYTHIHHRFICNRQKKMERIQMLFNKWIFLIAYSISIFYPAIKRHDMSYWLPHYVSESQNNYAKWKKPDQKNHTPFDSVYIKF